MLGTLTSIFILVFSTPESDTIVGTFNEGPDCEEVAWSMERYLSTAQVYCEELPPCETEDSTECFWDAQTMGNGVGQSFVAW